MLKCLLAALVPILMRADAVEDAARALAAKVAPHLQADERARITTHNASLMEAADRGRLRTAFEMALRKPARRRTSVPVVFTISQNAAGYLLVAEIREGDTEAVEMTTLAPPVAGHASALQPTVGKRLIWEQPDAVLDLVQAGDRMLVLEAKALVGFEQHDKQWRQAGVAALDAAVVRDPRGRLEIQGNDVFVFLPGATCRGTWQPLAVSCDQKSAEFLLDGAKVHFVAGRNTLEGARATRFGDEVAACNGKKLASGAGGRDEADTVAIFDGLIAASDGVALPGPVIALWPLADGALAVVHNLSTNQYAAYALTVDCGL